MRRWFEGAAASFVNAYRRALRERGIGEATTDGILQRTHLYEAAFLFKISTRRVSRLNSTRPGELSAMLTEIASCLSGAAHRNRAAPVALSSSVDHRRGAGQYA